MEIKRVLVAIDDTPLSKELIYFSCKICKFEKAKLFGIYVIEVPRALPLEAEIPVETEKGERIVEEVTNISEEFEIEAEVDFLQARDAGTAIVEHAKKINSNLIIIGMGKKICFEESEFVGTTAYVLKKAHCKVIVLRESLTSND